jgi:hypothetical protein
MQMYEMNSIKNPSVVSQISIGSLVLIALTGLTLAVVTIVLPTDPKAASAGGIAQPGVVLDIANASLEPEDTTVLISTEDDKLAQSPSSVPHTSTSEQSLGKSSFTRSTASVLETIVEQPVDSFVPPKTDNGHDVEFDLVFDESLESDELILDASLFAMNANSVSKEKVKAKIPMRRSSKEGSLKKSEKISPKGSLHQTALLFKNPTVLNGLDSKKLVVVAGREGTRVVIPADSLMFEDGSPCDGPYEAKVWEFYDFSDILLSGLTTMSDRGPLQTGGMIYLEMTSGGRKLNLKDGSKARITFAPYHRTDSGFELYNGTLDDKQILWSKVEQKKEKRATDSSGISVSMFPESLLKLSHFGNLVCLLNREVPTGGTRFFGTEVQKESFTGTGLARFPNGAKVLFDGCLEISKYDGHVGGSVDRCNLETRFEGTRLLAYFPVSNPKSSFKVFLPQEGFPVPFVTPKDFRKPSLFSYRKGEETSIDGLHGEVSFLSTKKRVSLSERSFTYEDRLGKGSIGLVSHLSKVFSIRDILGDFDGESFSVLDHLYSEAISKGKSIARRQVAQNMLFTNSSRRNFPINTNVNFLVNRSSGNEIGVGADFSLWRDLLEHLDELQKIAVSTGDPEAAEEFRQARNEFHEVGVDAGIEIQANIAANLSFRKEFLSPRLGWHNLDALRGRGNSATYELASNEQLLSSSLEETNSSISMGPFYFSVWPQERVSLVAGPGKNSIPQGAFTSMGYFLSEDGRLFADVSKGATGKVVSLNLREMDKENFRKKVKGFL